jgi:hypothetical protein
MDNPRAWIEHTLGVAANFIRSENLMHATLEPAKGDAGAPPYTTSPSSHFPPHLQMFIVPPDGEGKLLLDVLDSWTLLQEAATRSADFYMNLFSRIRIMRHNKAAFIAPTFSTINDRLIFAHGSRVGERDKIGERVNNWASNREAIRIEVGAGEMLVIDNHRYAKRIRCGSMLDGVESYSVWTDEITNHPEKKHLELAKNFKRKLREVMPNDTEEKTMFRFGLAERPLDDYVRAFLNTPSRLEELMPIYKHVFDELYLV